MATYSVGRLGWVVSAVLLLAATFGGSERSAKVCAGPCPPLPNLASSEEQKMDRMEFVVASKFGYAETVERLKKAIEAAGWSMPFEMDVKKTVEGKGFSADPTHIVGVCNAKHASTALREDPRIAAMLPCRIAVYEKAGKTYVTTLDARMLGTMYDGPSMAETATAVDAAMRAFVRAATEG